MENCFSCHGEKKQKSHLRLDSLAAALKGGDNGPAIVPGHPEKSELITAVSFTDPDLQMPPPKDKERLSAEQVAVLTEWVKMGRAVAGGDWGRGGGGRAEAQDDHGRRPGVLVVPAGEGAGRPRGRG